MLDDTPIYDLYVAGRGSIALAVAVRLGVFQALDEEPADVPGLARRLELSERGTAILLSALEAMGVVGQGDGGIYQASPEAREFLVPGKPQSLGGLLDLEFDSLLTPAAVAEAVRCGRANVYGGAEVWSTHEADAERAATFTSAMHSISSRPAAALAERLEPREGARLLDIGCGSGVYSAAALSRHPSLSAVLVDTEPVCQLASAKLDEEGLLGRAELVCCDMFSDPWPGPVDHVLFAQILHDWPEARCIELLRKAFGALRPGGEVLISEKLIEDGGAGPLANALVNLDMLFWTEGRQYRGAELCSMLSASGFVDARVEPTVGYWSLVRARKPRDEA